jgi:hypothetical protein
VIILIIGIGLRIIGIILRILIIRLISLMTLRLIIRRIIAIFRRRIKLLFHAWILHLGINWWMHIWAIRIPVWVIILNRFLNDFFLYSLPNIININFLVLPMSTISKLLIFMLSTGLLISNFSVVNIFLSAK